MQVQIKFKSTGSNSVYGSFEAGDLMRCDVGVAEHFVKEGLAVYTETPVPQTAKSLEPEAPETKRPRKQKHGADN